MNIVIFYKKPGCVTNAKQKTKLRKAGCMVIERNLFKHQMGPEEMYKFFEDKPVEKWFNPNAPLIKDEEIDPSKLNKDEALELLVSNPIMIKRPLLIIKNKKMSGFDQEKIEELLDIDLDNMSHLQSSAQSA